MKKLSISTLLTVIFLSFASFTSYAANGWQNEDGAWYYYRNDARVSNEWLAENGQTYYLGADGKMAVGVQMINGYYYCFAESGSLITNVEFEIWRDQRIVYDHNGRGVSTPMTKDDALYSSSCVQWMNQTYDIYTRYVGYVELYSSYTYTELPSVTDLLARDWGITNKDEGITAIKGLFEIGCAVEDKSVKAWNFSRAMMLCNSLYQAGWIDKNESVNMQYDMAPTIQQSFTSWQEFNDNYMTGYRRWAETVGQSPETIELREKAYSTSNYIVNENNEDKWIPWEKELVKLW